MKKLALALAISSVASYSSAAIQSISVSGNMNDGSAGSAFFAGGAIMAQPGAVDIDYIFDLTVDIVGATANVVSATLTLDGTYQSINPPTGAFADNTWDFDNAVYDVSAGSVVTTFPPVITSDFTFNGGVGATVATNQGAGLSPTSGSLNCIAGYCGLSPLLRGIETSASIDLLNGAAVTAGPMVISFGTTSTTYVANTSAVPVPAAAWLFGSALIGLAGIGRKRRV
jgi:hypothetical protein